jgi:hypothetical protein
MKINSYSFCVMYQEIFMRLQVEMRSQVKGGVVVDAFKAHEEFGSGV